MTMMRSGRAAAIAALAVIGLSTAVQTTTPSTAAAVASPQLVFAESAENSQASKSISAVCPSGKVVLGGGGRVGWDDSGKVFLTQLIPYANYYKASATELVGSAYNEDWKVQAWAVCGDPQLDPEIVTAVTTAPTGNSVKDAYAGCQDLGKVALGTGAAVTNHGSMVSLDYIKPHPNGWYVHARAITDGLKLGEGHLQPNYSLWAYAVCTDPPPGYEVVAVGSPELDDRLFGEQVPCPPGKKVYSAGLGKYDPTGHTHATGVFPNSDRSGVWTTAHAVDEYYWPWYLAAFATCADN